MNSKEIAVWIGRRIWLRKLGYRVIHWTTLREWYIKKGLQRYCRDLSDDPEILDAGCGLGQHLYFCATHRPQAKVLGLERDPQQVEDLNDFLLRSRVVNARVACVDLNEWQSDRSYDVVLCGSVLEHLADDRSVLRKLAGCLKPGGHLLIYVPSAERRVLAALEKKMQRSLQASGKRYPHDHVRYYAPQELADKVRSVGLDILQQKITYGRWGRWAYDLVTWVQWHRFFKWIFPLYLLCVHPLVLPLMWLDVYSNNLCGNGLWMVAGKPNIK